MEWSDFSSYHLVHIQVAPRSEWKGVLWISLVPAPEKVVVGKPGKEPGDLILTQVEGAPSSAAQNAVVSLGSQEKITPENIRRAGAAIIRWLNKNHAEAAGIDLDSLTSLNIQGAAKALYEGIQLGAFEFGRYKSTNNQNGSVQPTVEFVTSQDSAAIRHELESTASITQAVNMARDWAREPANVINPETLATRVQTIAQKHGLKCTVIDPDQLAKMGAGAILAVGQGSKTPSRLILIEYPGNGADSSAAPVAIVGKAITFDTGGYSLKDPTNIQTMKYDKSGGVDVLAILLAAAELKIKTPVVGVIAAAENMVSSFAYHPDDIITSLSGKTIEVISTDAEGRLVLADALTYVQNQYHPRTVIDIATLTGGVIVALGHIRAGLLSNNDTLAEALLTAGERTYERLWRMPLDDEYAKLIKSDEADIKNSAGREASTITGGIFIEQFVQDDTPWAHIDIAGMADTSKELPYSPKGSTGFSVRLLIDYLQNVD